MSENRPRGRKRRRRSNTKSASPSRDVDLAAARVAEAREALRQAEQELAEVEEQAVRESRPPTDLTMGHVLDETLRWVRRFPVAGVIAAGTIGFLLGRTGRRR